MNKKEYAKKYWLEHKEEMLKSHKEWYKNNIVENNKKRRQHYKENNAFREQRLEWAKEYRKKYPELVKQQKKIEYLKNRESYIARAKRNITDRRKIDPNFRLLENLRHRVNMAVRGNDKSKRTLELVGCSVDKLKVIIEKEIVMGIGEWVGLSSLLLTNIGSVYLTYNNFNRKINRIYERFDEYKTHIEENVDKKFVQKDLCGVVHSNSSNNLSGLEDRIEKRFDKLDSQIDRLLNK